MGIQIQHDPHFIEQRRAPRGNVPMEISIRERSRSAVAARTANLSAMGCQISGGGLLMEGTQLWIRLPGLESLTGRIIWSNGDCAGVAFAVPLHPAVADRFLAGTDDGTTYSAAAAAAPRPGHGTTVQPGLLMSRREQITQGVVDTNLSPLVKRKAPSGLGLTGRISRHVPRKVDHRHERRYADAISTGPAQLTIDGQDATVVNVSSSGLKLRGPLELQIGKKVTVAFDGFPPIKGTVVWVRGSETGISLPEHSLDLDGSASVQ